MKILVAADLHMSKIDSIQHDNLEYWIDKYKPDVLVIAGDVYENYIPNPFYRLSQLDCEVVFCLGNHEFVYSTVEDTLKKYSWLQPSYDTVHCLDVKGYVDIQGVRFFGNVLWYDGSMSERPDRMDYMENISTRWLDIDIKNFNPLEAHKDCVQQIKKAVEGYTGPSVMVTHTCPHLKLNRWCLTDPDSVFNIYSGVKDFFTTHDIYPDWAICGHTHKAEAFDYINDNHVVHCINVGNDYNECRVRLIEIGD